MNTFNRAEIERQAAEKLLEEAKSLIHDAKIRVDKGETEVDVRLKLRSVDLDFWRGELDNKLAQLKQEIEEAHSLKIRTDNEGRSVSDPIKITQQCITYRTQRQGCDLIRDEVDGSLDVELESLNSGQGLLGQTSMQMEEQLRLLKKCKFLIEKEHSEKELAIQVDEVAKGIKVTSLGSGGKKSGIKTTSVQHGRTGHPVSVSDWVNLTQQNLDKATRQVEGSYQLRSVVNGILAQVASNMKTSVDVTNLAFSRRIGEIREAKTKLEEQKAETIVKIQEVDDTIKSLEQALMAKQGPLATCQAKIQQRKLRPGMEYCHDEVDDHLSREQGTLLEIIKRLEGGILQAKHCYSGLQKTLLELEDEISKKANSLYIDEVKCGTLRKSIALNMY
ncbi:tektin-1 [Eurytemora carolleeae]|uniref:tektin-1 n=1 Tax=Eurytemora carolleeae TaxID=1294199 RepID=UPI000C77913F|nr:tektin-1 [Eurytemora carolleeae]|eukprot:XP_023338730.1 tektin-1-like [Eurytemora affinis]